MLKNVRNELTHKVVEYVRSVKRQKLWILGSCNTLRSIKNNCVFSHKLGASVKSPILVDLPAERLDYQSNPFTNVGVGYFGTFEATMLRRTLKRWCCHFDLFSTTRAFHIEVVISLLELFV